MKDYIRTTIRGGVVLCVPPKDMEELRATISRLLRYAYHEEECAVVASHYGHTPPCDCGYDALMAEVEDGK